MGRFSELSIFVRVAEERSLTRVADALEISVSSVSRQLASLEDRLGVRLVQRTTRHLSLTSEGIRFADDARDILFRLKDAEETVSAGAIEPEGLLRIGASLSFAILHLAPIVSRFCEAYPRVDTDVHVSNRYGDIIDNDLDVAIRTRRMEEDSSITVRKLADVKRLLAASPSYLSTRGVPASPADLEKHDFLLYKLADDWRTLSFRGDGEAATVSPRAHMASNDGQFLLQAALANRGILVQPAYILEEDILAGRLVPILTDWDLPCLTMNIAFPTRQNLPAKTRAFVDMVYDYFEGNALEERWLQLGIRGKPAAADLAAINKTG